MTTSQDTTSELERRIAELMAKHGHSRGEAEEIAAFEVDGPDVVDLADSDE